MVSKEAKCILSKMSKFKYISFTNLKQFGLFTKVVLFLRKKHFPSLYKSCNTVQIFIHLSETVTVGLPSFETTSVRLCLDTVVLG